MAVEIISKSVKETTEAALDFVSTLTPERDGATVVGLSGELGSGKTTFVQGAARALGVEQTVTSPTFVIEKIYKLSGQKFIHLIHIDAYRLENGGELTTLGFNELRRDRNNLILIEWPERVADILPQERKTILFVFIDENTRSISY